jgi:hydroxymethylbilane synthase
LGIKLTIGSRGSQLALWQANWTKARLEALGFECDVEIIQTTGDKITDVALSKVGTKGLFTKEIEEALLDGRIDLAVHSLKDMPTDLPEGLILAAIPEREDPRDAIVGKKLWELPQGATVGTSSLRRAAQMRVIRPDMRIENIRGNVDTRLRKLDEGQFDAILLAAAGLRRLGWQARIAETLEINDMCPAVGQGALAIETRADQGAGHKACGLLEDPTTRTCITAERALLAQLGGGCQVPVGAHATLVGGKLHLQAVVVSPDGAMVIKKSFDSLPAEAEELGKRGGDALLAEGGRQILESVYGSASALK